MDGLELCEKSALGVDALKLLDCSVSLSRGMRLVFGDMLQEKIILLTTCATFVTDIIVALLSFTVVNVAVA